MNRFSVSRATSLAALVAAALAFTPAPASAGDRGCSRPEAARAPAWTAGGGLAFASRDGYVFVQIGDRDGRRDARRDCGRRSGRYQAPRWRPEMRSCQHRFRGSECQSCGFVIRQRERCDHDGCGRDRCDRDYRDRDRCDRDVRVRACCDRRDSHRHERVVVRDCR